MCTPQLMAQTNSQSASQGPFAPSSPYSAEHGNRLSVMNPASAASAALPQQSPQQAAITQATPANPAPLATAQPAAAQPPGSAETTQGQPNAAATAAQPTASNSAPNQGDGEDGPAVSGIKTTHYGYPDDETPDSQTKAGKGKFGDLKQGDVALTDSLAAKLGVKGGEDLDVTDNQGKTHTMRYQDRAPQQGEDRIDIYNPTGSKAKGEPFIATSVKRAMGKKKSGAENLFGDNP